MANTFKFELVSPEKLILSADAVEVTVPGVEGEFGVFANHAAVMSSLQPGVVTAKFEDGEDKAFFVAGGFADVTATSLTVLAEFAIPKEELTREIYEERKRLAQEAHDRIIDGEDKKANARSLIEQLNHLEPTLLPA